MSIRETIWNWNGTPEEWRASYPCDRYLKEPYCMFLRAVDVQAPVGVMYRWLCQMTVAAYSYDLIDSWFRRSPRHLTPGADELEGRPLMGFLPIARFEEDSHITGVPNHRSQVDGIQALTYRVQSTGPQSCRVVVKVALDYRTRLQRIRAELLTWGDFIMMRKQLLTLKKLAERDAREAGLQNGAGGR